MTARFRRLSPCEGCKRRKVTKGYNCHDDPDYCPEYAEFRAGKDHRTREQMMDMQVRDLNINSIRNKSRGTKAVKAV